MVRGKCCRDNEGEKMNISVEIKEIPSSIMDLVDKSENEIFEKRQGGKEKWWEISVKR